MLIRVLAALTLVGALLAAPISAQPMRVPESPWINEKWFGAVDAKIALFRLEAHVAAIDKRLEPMVAAYDREVRATLRAAFEKLGVYDGALGYADTWSQNGVYWEWATGLRSFYTRHRAALQDSMHAIQLNGFALEEDLAWIDASMADWLSHERAAASLMERYVERLAQYALHLGDRMRVTDNPRFYVSSTPPEERAALRAEADRHGQLADAISTDGLREAIRSTGRTVLFTAIPGLAIAPDPGIAPAAEEVTSPIADRDEDICSALRDSRDALVRELDRLLAPKLPEERLRDWANLLQQIRDTAKGTGSDGKVVAERLRRHVPLAERLVPGFGRVIGRVADGVANWTGEISEATGVLDRVVAALNEAADIVETADSGSAQQQLMQLKATIDAIRRETPVGRIPGLSQLLEVQSRAIESIADSTGIIEQRAREFERIAREIIDRPIYIQGRGNRERLSDARQATMERIDKIDERLAEHGCNRPARQGLCEPRRTDVDAALANFSAAEQWRENAALSIRQVWDAHEVLADKARRPVFDAEGLREMYAERLLRPGSGAHPDRGFWQEQAARHARLRDEAQARLKLIEDRARDMRLLFERARQSHRDAVQKRLNARLWNDEERLYLRFCTSGGWRIPRPL